MQLPYTIDTDGKFIEQLCFGPDNLPTQLSIKIQKANSCEEPGKRIKYF